MGCACRHAAKIRELAAILRYLATMADVDDDERERESS
jgi:hypothetical protein